ncbi:hypothetical protein NBRC111894_3918 [Sporolactobacillus inulinus]|uniref:Uncharacterized protein n=1 Tax=Sporolactobacillus inulinus TaxID=2078 RepID=A0A4Y1ZHI2_9BACL|nr:hypothetical protein NBRC111894_3918 [Sporolactobacillus inulinus]
MQNVPPLTVFMLIILYFSLLKSTDAACEQTKSPLSIGEPTDKGRISFVVPPSFKALKCFLSRAGYARKRLFLLTN